MVGLARAFIPRPVCARGDSCSVDLTPHIWASRGTCPSDYRLVCGEQDTALTGPGHIRTVPVAFV